MSSRLRIIVTGLITQHPTLGGVTWDYLQYALGLLRLGHDVFYVEDSGEWPYNLDGGESGNDWIARDPMANVRHLANVMARFGLGERWAYRFPLKDQWFGLSELQREEVLGTADLLINVSGTLEHPDRYAHVNRLAYIDSDPLFTQVKAALPDSEFRKRVDAHHVHFSFGESLSDLVPVTGHYWRSTRHPMVLDEWSPISEHRKVTTTVMNWTSYQPLRYLGRTFGQKDVEFRRFLELPSRVNPLRLEVALAKTQHIDWQSEGQAWPPQARQFLESHPKANPCELLAHHGWRVVDPVEHCADLDSYRAYIRSSTAEWSIAKNGYVQARTGWFSCRSACYLAAGRPVVVQNTGFSDVLPTGKGILVFDTLDEAAEALREVNANYKLHSHAAREIAAECFDSRRVLGRLVETAMSAAQQHSISEAHA